MITRDAEMDSRLIESSQSVVVRGRGLMAARNFTLLPVVEAGRVVGVISIGDVVKDNIGQMGQQIGFLETYIKGHSASL